ncbi:MAG: 30S ribosomal protein S4 [Gemmataceae bacterium]|nr:30S ribosomal protein S4 [Gemmataceae bacterium]
MRFTSAKGKINRALGMIIYENRGAVRAFERHPQPPGMHMRRGKQSNYGMAMSEKKKIKHYYGMHERQLLRFFQLAAKSPENTGEALLVLCERRLDNVVRRATLTRTRPQARQGINHGHLRVNGKKVDICSYLVKAGDVIEVAPRPNVLRVYRELVSRPEGAAADWLHIDTEALRVTVQRLPTAVDISLPVEANRVVELLSR